MNIQELRIGNYVNHVYKGNFKILKSHFPSLMINFIDPIPLTEDILLKCGFVEKGVTFNTKINFTRCCLFKVNSSNNYNNNENEFSVTLYQHHNSIEIARIKYLHQLQNLFFALTGEELNIEL